MYRFFTALWMVCLLPGLSPSLLGQCTPLDSAIQGISLTASGSGTSNRSGVVFNPGKGLYYSVNAGSSNYPIDVYDETGAILTSVTASFDYRGAWWNPALNTFEGNGFSSSGIFLQTLQAGTGYPAGSGAVLFTSNQPDDQSVGALDYDNNHIIYYYDGFIYRYSRVDNGLLSQTLVQGLPVATTDINSNSIVYTGCEGREIGLYDHVNRRLLFINKQTNTFNGFCQLPADAPQRSSFGVSYANGSLFLFAAGTWQSYQVVSIWPTAVEEKVELALTVSPNPATDWLNVSWEHTGKPVTLDILSIQGQVLRSMELPTGNEHPLNVSDLPAGLYLIRLQAGQQAATRRFTRL